MRVITSPKMRISRGPHVSLILPILYRFNRKWMWVGISPWSPWNTNHGLLGFFFFWRRSRIHNYGYSTFTHPMLYVKNTNSNVILWKNVEYSNQILLAKTLHYGSDILSWSSDCKIFSNMSKFIISDSRPKWSIDKYKFCPRYSKGPIIYFLMTDLHHSVIALMEHFLEGTFQSTPFKEMFH